MTAFEEIFRENRAFIFKYLMKLSKNAPLAEELTQETFFRAYMNFAALKDRQRAVGWLLTIARNTYFAWYREQKKIVLPDDPDVFGDDMGPEEIYEQKELSEKALSCLSALGEPYREVFLLAVFGNLSFKEISSSFGKSESWARVTFYRAKQKLSESMGNQYGM